MVAATGAAPGGVWLKWWTYDTGFAILAAVHPWTAAATIAVLLASIVLFILGRRFKSDFAELFLCLHLIVALACGIAWYIPVYYSDPEGLRYPPIHDVSTDLVDIPQFTAVLPQRIGASGTEYGETYGMTPERNAQLQQQFYPELTPRYYDRDADDMYYRAYSAAIEMGWAVVAASVAEGRIEATATTFWFRMKEDVVIRIRSEGERSRIDARSVSRVEGGDDGSNARRLLEFFDRLNADAPRS